MTHSIIITGHAGSGKSTLTEKFSEYLKELGYNVACVNLDPASPPRYSASADIRDFVKTEKIMEELNLGINGGLLKSMEIALNHINELTLSDECEFVLYDTPGQLELFIFTEFGEKFVKSLTGPVVGIFMADSSRIKNSAQYSAMVSQSAVVSVLLEIPFVTVFNKSDTAKIRDLEYYLAELKKEGIIGEYFEILMRFIELTSLIQKPIRVSSKTKEGFYDLYTAINEVLCTCGDLS